MDKEFFQAGLNLFADFLQFNPSICHDLYSQYAPVTRISDHANLYFAYGSNMDMQQMRSRCPSARFIGLSNIKNFEYYIDKRGVASLRLSLAQPLREFFGIFVIQMIGARWIVMKAFVKTITVAIIL